MSRVFWTHRSGDERPQTIGGLQRLEERIARPSSVGTTVEGRRFQSTVLLENVLLRSAVKSTRRIVGALTETPPVTTAPTRSRAVETQQVIK